MKEIKNIIGDNLAMLRKANKLTQQDLANQFNYSDKTISKWEKGEALPAIEVIIELTRFYKCTLDYLTEEHSEVNAQEFPKSKNLTNYKTKKHFLVTMIAITSLWIISTILFVILKLSLHLNIWMIFIWTVPASLCSLIFFNIFWGNKKYWVHLESISLWATLICFYLQFLKFNPWPIFVIGIPIQSLVLLLNLLLKNHNKLHTVK